MNEERVIVIVYGASKGEYSDHKICAIFSSEELAQKFITGRVGEELAERWTCFGGCEESHPTVRDDTGKQIVYRCAGCGYNRSHLFDEYHIEIFDFYSEEGEGHHERNDH